MDLSSSISPPNPTAKPFTNGGSSLKSPVNMTGVVVTYRECLKNHAASIGGHALDGCGEFMPSPTAVPADPSSLKCAACGCHRNFHRRDSPEEQQQQQHHPNKPLHHHLNFHLHHSPPFPPATAPAPPHRHSSPSPSLSPGRSSSPGPTPSPTPSPHSPPPVSHLPPNSYFASPAPPPAQMLLALSAGKTGGFAPPCDELGRGLGRTAVRSSGENSQARKRFRTKFSQEQKDKMCLFAERLDWKMQRSEEKLVEEFCREIGIRKGVLKVWMHNNKHTIGKRERGVANGVGNSTVNGDNRASGFDSRADNHEDDEDDDDIGNDVDDIEKDEDRKSNLNFFANGSSSSS